LFPEVIFPAKSDFQDGSKSALLIVDTKSQPAPEELDLHQRSNLQTPLLQQEQLQVSQLFSDFEKYRTSNTMSCENGIRTLLCFDFAH